MRCSPRCSTVTVSASSNTRSRSCSTSITVTLRGSPDEFGQLGGLRRGHPRRRLVQQQQTRRAASATATSSCRRSPWDSAPAIVPPVREPHRPPERCARSTRPSVPSPPGAPGGRPALPLLEREQDVLQQRRGQEQAGVLEGRGDAGLDPPVPGSRVTSGPRRPRSPAAPQRARHQVRAASSCPRRSGRSPRAGHRPAPCSRHGGHGLQGAEPAAEPWRSSSTAVTPSPPPVPTPATVPGGGPGAAGRRRRRTGRRAAAAPGRRRSRRASHGSRSRAPRPTQAPPIERRRR